MPWKYSIGYKLSNRGRNKLIEYVRARGYKIMESGWDFIVTETQLLVTDRTALTQALQNLLLFEEEEVTAQIA